MANTTARIRLALDGVAAVEQGFASVEKRIGGAGRALLGLAGGVSLAGFAAFVKTGIDAADSMAKLSQKAGLAVQDMAGLQLAFRQSGISAEQFAPAMAKLGVAVANGNDAFKAMGIATKNADGSLKSTRQVLGEVSTAFAGYENSAAKTALAVKLFGRSGAELMPLLNQGAKSLADYDDVARKLGLTMDEETTKAAERFNDQIDLLSQKSQGLARQLATDLLPVLTAISSELANGAKEGGTFSSIGAGLSNTIEAVTVVGANFAFVLKTLARDGRAIYQVYADIAALDFDGLRRNADSYRVETLAARDALDSFERKVLGARRLANSLSGADAYDEPWVRRAKAMAGAATKPAPIIEGPNIDKTREAEKALTEERRRSAQVVELRNKLVGEGYLADQKNIQAARESNRELVQRYADSAASAGQRLTDMQNEADAIAYAEKYQIGVAQAVELTTIARLKEQQVAAMGNEDIVLQLQAEIDARQKIVGMLDSKQAREAGANLRKNQADEWAKTWDQVGQSFTDALMQGGKSAAQYLKDLFRTLVLRPLLAPIGGAVTSLMGGPAAAGQAGGGGLGTLSSLQSAYNGLSTGFSGIGASVGSIGASFQYGTAAFSQQSTMLAAQEAGMGTMTGNLASAGSMLGGALVGFMAGKMISGGYSAIGKSGNAAVVAGTAIGAFVGGPIGAAIGGALGGAFNRVFGRKAPVSTGSGITGEFSTMGASVQGYNDQFAKGGVFRSNKSWTEYSAVSTELDDFLDQSLVAITGATRDYAALLGLNADAVNGATQSIRLSLKDLNEEQQKAAILGALSGFGDVLAGRVLGGDGAAFIRDGETTGAALTRLATSLTAVNIVFDTLNTTLLKGSLIGADAASKLIDAFGGADAFTAQTGAYYQAFYSQAERTSTATRQLTEVLAGLGLALPESRTAFRELVEAQDLYTDAGRATYAALIGLAPVFDQITQATEQMGKALSDEVLRLRGLLTGSSVNSVGALQADFAIATAAARAGDAGALERLPAISQALESAAALQAVTAADIAIVRGQLAASLSDTMRTLGLDVPQFAVGTNYVPRDMLAKVHEGEAIVPRAYNPAAGGRAGNDALVAELRAVRAELEGLRAEVRADVGHNAKTARILERVTPDGTSIITTAEA